MELIINNDKYEININELWDRIIIPALEQLNHSPSDEWFLYYCPVGVYADTLQEYFKSDDLGTFFRISMYSYVNKEKNITVLTTSCPAIHPDFIALENKSDDRGIDSINLRHNIKKLVTVKKDA